MIQLRKKNYLFDPIRKLSNEHDLMGLISLGAPEDEYDPETKIISKKLSRMSNPTVEQITTIVYLVYHQWFGDSFTFEENDPAFHELALEISSKLNKLK